METIIICRESLKTKAETMIAKLQTLNSGYLLVSQYALFVIHIFYLHRYSQNSYSSLTVASVLAAISVRSLSTVRICVVQ